MRNPLTRIVCSIVAGLVVLQSPSNCQKIPERNGLEVTIQVQGALTDGDAFGWSGRGVSTTASLAYTLTPSFVFHGGVSVTAVDPNTQALSTPDQAGVGLPWLPDTRDEYVFVFAGPSFWFYSDNSRVTPFVGGKLSYVKQTREDARTGWGIGGTGGVHWLLTRHLGLEFVTDVSLVRLHSQFLLYKGGTHETGAYVPRTVGNWVDGVAMMAGVGLVYRLR